MSLPRYPEYKDSGVDWLGELPAHWAVAPLKRGYDVRLGKMLQPDRASDDDILAPYLRAANIQWGGVELENLKSMWFSTRERELLALKKGDLLVSEGGDVGRSSLWQEELEGCYFQNSVNRVRSRGTDRTDYLHYWMATIKSKGYVDVLCNKSTIAHFTAEKVEAVPTPYPSPEEQRQIAAFLDYETARIDALIAEQEKLLALLAEKRQATISHAVTRGLDPNVPMKDSGIAWLGEVPAHWETYRLGALFREVNEPGADDLPVLSVSIHSGVSDRELGEDDLDRKVSRSEDRSKYKSVAPGDLTYNMMRAWQGAFGSVAVTGMVSPAYVVGRPKKDFLTSYVEWVLRMPVAASEIRRHSRGITDFRLRLYWEEFKEIKIALPPKREQLEIAEFVRGVSARIDSLQLQAEHNIVLLQERRSALISAAVTGQIDVRGIA